MKKSPEVAVEGAPRPAVPAAGLRNVPGTVHDDDAAQDNSRTRISLFSGWERQERVALVLLVAVTIVVLAGHLVFSAVGKAPFARPYSDAAHDGDLVYLQGVIGRMAHTQEGGHLILEVEGLPVFVPASASQGHAFRMGDTISLYGTVQTYRGEREIVVQDGGDIWINLPGEAGTEG